MQKIGQLFLLRTNINSVGSVLDSPVRKCSLGTCGTLLTYSLGSVLGSRGLLWGPFVKLTYPSQQSYPDLQPLYDAARSYLEIPQRINLLNTRVEVRISHSISSRKSKQNIDRTAGASRHERILAAFTLYAQMRCAQSESDFEPIVRRLQSEWAVVGTLVRTSFFIYTHVEAARLSLQ